MSCFREIGSIFKDEGPFALIIVDSMTALLRVDYVGRGELSSRQQLLGQMLSTLIKIGTEYNVAVVITNQVMSNPDGGMTFVSDPKKAVGGHVLAHASTWRCEMKKGGGECRVIKVVDSPTMPEGEATFRLSDKGCCDADS
jgi:meiotic recombination protein DMC1